LNRTFLSIPQLDSNFSRKAGARASTDILLMLTLAKMPQPLINDSKIAQTTTGQPTHIIYACWPAGAIDKGCRRKQADAEVGICLGSVVRTAAGAGAICSASVS
jgi:hypothetical protein